MTQHKTTGFIEAELSDGSILEFPDGTPESVIDTVVKRYISGAISDRDSGGEGANIVASALPAGADVRPIVEALARDFDKNDGYLEQLGDNAQRGIAAFGSDAQRFASTIASSIGADSVADTWREAAIENEAISGSAIAGETNWEGLKAAPSLSNLGRFVLEQGIGSLPHMAAAVAALPVEIAAQMGRIGQSRAENNGRDDATITDLALAAPAATIASLFERIGAKAIITPAAGRSIAAGAARAGGKEAATEAGQEALQYGGGTIGTDAGFDPAVAAELALAGAVAGGPLGAAGHAAVDGTRRGVSALQRRGLVDATLPPMSDEEVARLVAQANAMPADDLAIDPNAIEVSIVGGQAASLPIISRGDGEVDRPSLMRGSEAPRPSIAELVSGVLHKAPSIIAIAA